MQEHFCEMVPAEFGHWCRVRADATNGQQHDASEMLRESLIKVLHDHGIYSDLEVRPWNVEERYGRDELKLEDGEIALGVHVYTWVHSA